MSSVPIPDEAVEAAAKAGYEATGGDWRWVDLDGATRDMERDVARHMLEAAAPHLMAQAWDEGAQEAWSRSTPEVNGAAYKWRHEGEPINPYHTT